MGVAPSTRDLSSPPGRGAFERAARQAIGPTTSTVTVPELDVDVRVVRDASGSLHVFADTELDAVVAQGFLHAQDRLFQLEMTRRTCYGTVSELFGAASIDSDKAVRILGFAELAAGDWEQADAVERALLQAYADGINAYMSTHPQHAAVEFDLLKNRLEPGKKVWTPWLPRDTLALQRYWSYYYGVSSFAKIVRATLIEILGADLARQLDPVAPAAQPVVPEGVTKWLVPIDTFATLQTGSISGIVSDIGSAVGSNAVAVAGWRSATGAALLANDPHFAAAVPSTFYNITLHAERDDLHVSGLSVPGTPFVAVGHNNHISWGMAASYADACDVYLVDWRDPTKLQYRWNDGYRSARHRREKVLVAGDESVSFTVVETHLGPVVTRHAALTGHPRAATTSVTHDLVARSAALQPGVMGVRGGVAGAWALAHARNWEQFRAAARLIPFNVNLVYADAQGNIGSQMCGFVPLRMEQANLSVPVPGWTDKYDWAGMLGLDEMPWSYNPKEGFVIAANQRCTGSDYPYELGNLFKHDARAERLGQLLRAKDKHDIDDLRQYQLDTVSLPALRLIKAIGSELYFMNSYAQRWITLLRAWDGRMDRDSGEALLYKVFASTLCKDLVARHLPAEVYDAWIGSPTQQSLLGVYIGHPAVLLTRLLEMDSPPSLLTEAGGRDTAIRNSFEKALESVKLALPDEDTWRYGAFHVVRWRHAMSRASDALARVLDPRTEPMPMSGDHDTVLMTSSSTLEEFGEATIVPAARYLVDMANLAKVMAIVPPGNSGQPMSPFYADHLDSWAVGMPRTLAWTREKVEEENAGTIMLQWAPRLSIPAAEIIHARHSKSYAVYFLTFYQHGMEPATCPRRYSVLRAFATSKQVQKEIRRVGVVLPPFPGRTLGRTSMVDPGKVEKRRTALQRWFLAFYARIPEARDLLLSFLGLMSRLPDASPVGRVAVPSEYTLTRKLAEANVGGGSTAKRRTIGRGLMSRGSSRGSRASRASRSSRGSRGSGARGAAASSTRGPGGASVRG